MYIGYCKRIEKAVLDCVACAACYKSLEKDEKYKDGLCKYFRGEWYNYPD